MRFQDRDAMTFKVFRKDADRIYPTRVRGLVSFGTGMRRSNGVTLSLRIHVP